MKVNATGKVKDKEGNILDTVEMEVDYDFGETVDDAVAMFGAEIVFSNFRQSAVISLQSRLRSHIAAGLSVDETTAKCLEWKPGVKVSNKKSKADKLKELTAGMSAEDVAALIASISGGDE